MAQPVGFEGANFLLSGEKAGCADLETFNDGHVIISCWRLTSEELTKVAETGVVWLAAYGGMHPPVLISGEPLVTVHGRPAKPEPIMPKVKR